MPSEPRLPYEVMIDEQQWAQIEALPNDSLKERATTFLVGHARLAPRERLASGSLKELQGEYKGYWQLDLDRKHRLIYTVDDQERRVYVQYVGAHPDWGRGPSRGRRIRS